MKYIITILLFLSINTFATDWDAMYKALKNYESGNGQEMAGTDGKHFGWIHIGQAVLDDFNKRNKGRLRRFLTLRDTYNEKTCKIVMKDHMQHYARALKKQKRINTDMYVYFSIWRHGYNGTKRKGAWNRYSRRLVKDTKEIIEAKALIQKSQSALYKQNKKG